MVRVAISSVLPRSSFYYQGYRQEINDLLRKECSKYGFHFIENKNIILKNHILKDGVHLNFTGTGLLRDNLLEFVNSSS